MDKHILNKVKELENRYPLINFDVNKYVDEFVTPLEDFLQTEIKNRIKLSEERYTNIDKLDREILSFLTKEELQRISYHIIDNRKA